MTKDEVEGWLKTGRTQAIADLGLDAKWWPTTAKKNQSLASAWALAFFIEAAKNRCSGHVLTAACSADPSTKPNSHTVVKSRWISAPGRVLETTQVLVDFSVHNWDASSPVQMTGESETYGQHGVKDSLSSADDYSWDFYKLLVIPSSSRLFFARVAGDGGVSAEDRCDMLAATLKGLVDWYGPSLLRTHDELGAAIVPASTKQRDRAVILWLDRGRLRSERITSGLLA